MIVICPLCSTRFLVDARALGAGGRLVRCGKCVHTWHQGPAEDESHRIEVVGPARDDLSPSFGEDLAASLRSEGRIQLPALSQKRRIPWIAVGWAILILVVIGGIGGFWFERDKVAVLWPQTTRLYGLFGSNAGTQSDWYSLTITPRNDYDNGTQRLVIDGEIINNSGAIHPIPKLKVELRDANNRVVQSWTFAATEDRLLPGTSVPFTTSVTQPNAAATGVTVTAAGPGE